jgi:GWxTD domain-containing protein
VTAEKKYAAADSFQVLFIMQDKEGRALKQIRKASRKPGTSCVQSVILPVANLPSGEYTLKVRVSDPGNGASAEVSGQFNMYWHPLSLKDYKLEEILEQLHLIASRDEMRELSRLPEAEQLQGIFEFWKRRDPTPGTLQNEAMDEYYRRVDYAERHFTGKGRGRQGWKSPQGKIYLAYGAPDEIHRFTNSTTYQAIDGGMRRVFPAQNQPWRSSSVGTGRYSQLNDDGPHEVWKYHQLNREFIFVDKHGTGSYELIDPMFLN